MSSVEQPARLTSAATDMYMASSLLALSLGVLSWDQYLLRLQFVRENAESDSLQADTVRRLLGWQKFEVEEEWPFGEREQTDVDGASSSGTQDPSHGTTIRQFFISSLRISVYRIGSFTSAMMTSSHRSPTDTISLGDRGSWTPTGAGFIKRIRKWVASLAGRSWRFGMMRSSGRLPPPQSPTML